MCSACVRSQCLCVGVYFVEMCAQAVWCVWVHVLCRVYVYLFAPFVNVLQYIRPRFTSFPHVSLHSTNTSFPICQCTHTVHTLVSEAQLTLLTSLSHTAPYVLTTLSIIIFRLTLSSISFGPQRPLPTMKRLSPHVHAPSIVQLYRVQANARLVVAADVGDQTGGVIVMLVPDDSRDVSRPAAAADYN